ncbi:lysophospholipase D GDPD1 isoform X1 [Lepidochelys kempii]|uniref:lysophospholipase D GDPD1 isoform X1 n=1 Tax=Lepidochelys kempii TaxID=8472 RepID=UPI003C6FB3CE
MSPQVLELSQFPSREGRAPSSRVRLRACALRSLARVDRRERLRLRGVGRARARLPEADRLGGSGQDGRRRPVSGVYAGRLPPHLGAAAQVPGTAAPAQAAALPLPAHLPPRRCWREPGKHNDSFSPELPPYLCKLDVTFQKECHCEGEDNRIPLLKEVFEAFPNTPVNIDIKVNNNVLIKKVSELVSQYKRERLTVWGNVNYEIVEKCHKENADIPILFCLKRVLLLVGLFYTGLLPFIPIREEFLEIPMPSIILKLKEPEKMTRSQKFVIWLADVLLMRKALFDHLTARGIQVYIWVLNEEQEYKRAFDLGATGVMTDYPTKLKEFLHNYSA